MAMTSRQHPSPRQSGEQQPGTVSPTVGETHIPLDDPDAETAGWVAYGGVLLLVLGAMYVVFAVVAIVHHQWSVWASRDVLLLDPYQWGWVHLGVGAVVALAGVGVLTGSVVGRRVGAVVAAAAMLVSFLALTAFPLWSIVMMAVGTLILYCLVVGGGVAGHRQHPSVCRRE